MEGGSTQRRGDAFDAGRTKGHARVFGLAALPAARQVAVAVHAGGPVAVQLLLEVGVAGLRRVGVGHVAGGEQVLLAVQAPARGMAHGC